jgi:hypothetical protein
MSAFQMVDDVIVIADEETLAAMGVEEGVFKDLSELYPDEPGATRFGYMLNATDFASDIEYPALAGNLFIGFREPRGRKPADLEKFTENYNNAITLWNNYLNGTVINP